MYAMSWKQRERSSARFVMLLTASECIGWSAKRVPVARTASLPSLGTWAKWMWAVARTSNVARACSATETRWNECGSSPVRWWFRRNVIVVSGRQLLWDIALRIGMPQKSAVQNSAVNMPSKGPVTSGFSTTHFTEKMNEKRGL